MKFSPRRVRVRYCKTCSSLLDRLALFGSERLRITLIPSPSTFWRDAYSLVVHQTPRTTTPMSAHAAHSHHASRGSSLRDYLPLVVIIALTLLAASARQVSLSGTDLMLWMHDFMGFFLIIFSMFKLFDLSGFADGFQMYDLLAKRFRPYAYIYPFIELGLGLGYLAHWEPGTVYITTLVVMLWGSLGVIAALAKGLNINCACMGTVLKVPLSTVALLEDLGMAAMAAGMLYYTA